MATLTPALWLAGFAHAERGRLPGMGCRRKGGLWQGRPAKQKGKPKSARGGETVPAAVAPAGRDVEKTYHGNGAGFTGLSSGQPGIPTAGHLFVIGAHRAGSGEADVFCKPGRVESSPQRARRVRRKCCRKWMLRSPSYSDDQRGWVFRGNGALAKGAERRSAAGSAGDGELPQPHLRHASAGVSALIVKARERRGALDGGDRNATE